MKRTYILNSYTVVTYSDVIKISSSKGSIISVLISISALIFFSLNLMPIGISLFIICATWFFYFVRTHIYINTKTKKIWKAISIFGKPIKLSFYLNLDLDSVKIIVLEDMTAGTDSSGGSIVYVVYAIQKNNKAKKFLIQLDEKKEIFLFESMLKEAGYGDFEIRWRKS